MDTGGGNVQRACGSLYSLMVSIAITSSQYIAEGVDSHLEFIGVLLQNVMVEGASSSCIPRAENGTGYRGSPAATGPGLFSVFLGDIWM